MKVLVTDPISEEGIDILRSQAQVDIKVGLKPEEIIAAIGDYEALVVRSQTEVTSDIIDAGINISQMQVSLGIQRGGKAMMVLCLDEFLPAECYQRILAIPDMYRALMVKLAS